MSGTLDGDVLERVGVLRAARFITRRTPRVIMYHRFAAQHSRWRMGVDRFERQLIYLQKHYKLMTISDVARRIRADSLPENSAAITVDDCYEDFYLHAWPVLKKYGVPVTLYAVSGFIARRMWLWPDLIRYVTLKTQRPQVEFALRGRVFNLDMRTEDERAASWGKLADEALTLGNDERIQFISELGAVFNVRVPDLPVDDFRAMTWEQLRDVDRAGSEVGAHSISHPRLTSLALNAAIQEINGSKAEIEKHLGRRVTAFCYPNGGRADFNDAIKLAVKDCGYENATTTVMPKVGRVDLYAIGRIGAEGNLRRFRRSLTGVTQLTSLMADTLRRPFAQENPHR
jgi:peptidoglycan/xylan/chitin deacetylase (PgdA/CDA1 family)